MENFICHSNKCMFSWLFHIIISIEHLQFAAQKKRARNEWQCGYKFAFTFVCRFFFFFVSFDPSFGFDEHYLLKPMHLHIHIYTESHFLVMIWATMWCAAYVFNTFLSRWLPKKKNPKIENAFLQTKSILRSWSLSMVLCLCLFAIKCSLSALFPVGNRIGWYGVVLFFSFVFFLFVSRSLIAPALICTLCDC